MPHPDKSNVELHRGLKDVYIDKTDISDLRTDELGLLYRGYPISCVAQTSYEQTIYLLLYGRFPTTEECEKLKQQLLEYQALPDEIIDLIERLKNSHPLVVLRTVMSALVAYSPQALNSEDSPEIAIARSLYALSVAASTITTHHALRNGKNSPPPDPTLPHAANFLYRLTGVKPSPEEIKIIDKSFILLAEHGSNASTFTARVTTSTGADFYASMTAALASLGGSLHGGAMGEVVEMLEEIDYSSDIFAQLKQRRKRGKRISGFGHRIYKKVDPRASHLKVYAQRLAQMKGSDLFTKAEAVEGAMAPYQRLGVNVNVDFYLSIVYFLLEIPADTITITAGLSRMLGWAAHIIEQKQNNILIRPSLVYTGEIFEDCASTP
ncbi:MAG: citrate/2-methylcitrate synthase [Cyanobacteriota bacterium]|nr:citrate/2-methylcitrate synthase [Cyanobacteriota bacterium]